MWPNKHVSKSRIYILVILMAIIFGFSNATNATLIDRGGGLIYDDVLDITWLQDANYAMTSGYDADGMMFWANAVSWADTLSYYDSVRDATWDDWRLPTTVDGPYVFGYDGTTTGGYNITTSEMGYMNYENLGNLGYYATDGTNPQPGWGLNNTGPFINLDSSWYWSGIENAAEPARAWGFGFDVGNQHVGYKNSDYYVWAVRDGDVVSGGPVPEPATMLLLGSGLLGLAGYGKKKFRKK